MVAVALVGSAEWFLRSRGHRPSVVDDVELWAYHRAKVSDGNENHVAILGLSRVHLGFSSEVFREQFPNYEVTQLAITGKQPIAALRDLAGDEDFCGIAVCSVTVGGLRQGSWEPQQEYVDYYHEQYRPHHAVDVLARSFCQEHLAVLYPAVRMDKLFWRSMSGRPMPDPYYVLTRADRTRCADYSLVDAAAFRQRKLEKVRQSMGEAAPVNDRWIAGWHEDLAVIKTYVEAIQARGGEVVFVRYPTTGEYWELTQERYPMDIFWDRLAEHTSAKTIHFADVPAMDVFDLPELSHLDHNDVAAFTSALLDELTRQDVLERP